jgi:hypothetical protein
MDIIKVVVYLEEAARCHPALLTEAVGGGEVLLTGVLPHTRGHHNHRGARGTLPASSGVGHGALPASSGVGHGALPASSGVGQGTSSLFRSGAGHFQPPQG